MGGLGAWEVILIFLVLLLLFGAKRLPELAKGLGKSLKEFKKATSDIQEEIETAMDDTNQIDSSKKNDKSNKDKE